MPSVPAPDQPKIGVNLETASVIYKETPDAVWRTSPVAIPSGLVRMHLHYAKSLLLCLSQGRFGLTMQLSSVDSRCEERAEDGFAEVELAEILQERLRGSSQADLRQVRVAARDGIVRLLGRVPSFYAKQIAQIVISEHFGAWRVENAIEVA